MNNPAWKDTELVVSYLEKRLSDNSVVKHNVILPDLTGDSSGRQCDVVIKTGKPPRQTITIVEVQDRKSKVNINTFDGFVNKMRTVGAQHLIVVSRAGFPDSVISRAKKHGPTIRLVKLNELLADDFPLFLYENQILINDRRIKRLDIRIGVSSAYKDKINIPQNSEYLSSQFKLTINGELVDLTQLIFRYLKQTEYELVKGENEITFKIGEESGITVQLEDNVPIKVKISAIIESTDYKLDMNYFEYVQHDESNPLVWYAEGRGVFKGKPAKVGLSFLYDEDMDRFMMRYEYAEGNFGELTFKIYELGKDKDKK